jgi:hypothetical protein
MGKVEYNRGNKAKCPAALEKNAMCAIKDLASL